MDTKTIIITILSSTFLSGVLSAIISYLNVQRVKSAEFKFDYKKYILEKRKEAYDVLEKAIKTNFNFKSLAVHDHSKLDIIQRNIDVSILIAKYDSAVKERVWLTNRLHYALVHYLKGLQYYKNELAADETKVKEIYGTIEKYREAILREEWKNDDTFHDKIVGIFFKDLIELNNIEKFVHEKSDPAQQEEYLKRRSRKQK